MKLKIELKKYILIAFLFTLNLVYCQEINKIEKTEIQGGNFKELYNWKHELKNVTVVGLGESNHHMGTTFKSKVGMIKYLHDSLGFNTIAFESGMYDCYKANKLMKEGRSNSEDFFNALFPFWRSNEVLELYEYILNSYQTENPIEFVGIDMQALNLSEKYLKDDYKMLFDTLKHYNDVVTVSDRFYELLDKEIKYSNYFKKFDQEDTAYFGEKLREISNIITKNELDTATYFSFWNRISKNIIMDFTRMHYNQNQRTTRRDSTMYENLSWHFIQDSTRKTIIWAASFHLVLDVKSIFYNKRQSTDFNTLGMYCKKNLKDKYYFIAFTPLEGKFGFKEKGLFTSYKVKKTTQNSIEYFINQQTNYDFAMLSLRNKVNIQFIMDNEIKRTKFLGAKETEMIPYNVADAVFYIKTMGIPQYIFN